MESQNVEYKQSWKDDYLRWICGFANAQGGTIYIGIDDNGNVCGVKDSKKLLEDIPNKVVNYMGIVVDRVGGFSHRFCHVLLKKRFF